MRRNAASPQDIAEVTGDSDRSDKDYAVTRRLRFSGKFSKLLDAIAYIKSSETSRLTWNNDGVANWVLELLHL